MSKKIVTILLVLAVVCTSVFANATAEQQTKTVDVINVVYHPTIGGATAIGVAEALGYFEEEGLKVNLQMYTSGPPEIAAMAAGQVDVGFIGSGAAWLAFSGQVDIVALDNLALTEEIIARPGINSVADLKGKTVAVQEGAAGYTLLLVALKANGMSINDVKVLNIANDNIPSTFGDKSIDVWAGWKPATTSLKTALGEGNYTILATNETYPEYAFPSTWVANKDFVKNKSDVLAKFLRALNKAQVYRSENPNQACAFASTYAQQATNDLTGQLPDVVFPSDEQFKQYYTTTAFADMLENLKATQSAKVTGSLTIDDILSDEIVKGIYN